MTACDKIISRIFLGLFLMSLSQIAVAHTSNPKLEYSMKVMAKDVSQVISPTKAESPTDVTDGEILTAIMRARSATFFLNSIKENKGKVENGKVIVGEFSPGGWDDAVKPEEVEKVKNLIPIFDDFVVKVVQALKTAEAQLEMEFKKKPETRNFAALAKTGSEIDNLMAEAHKIFRPKPISTATTVTDIVHQMEE